jgi:hypothetical protein
MSSSESSK